MQKRIGFLIFTCLLFTSSFAATFIGNDSIPPKTRQLSKQEFLDGYAWDDSSLALIHYYFEKKRKAKYTTIIGTAAGSGAAIGFDKIVMRPRSSNETFPNGRNNTGDMFTGFLFGFVIFVAAVAVPAGVFNLVRFSRKNLLKHLYNYKAMHSLPKWVTRSTSFRKHLNK